jgi:hypothetical protein
MVCQVRSCSSALLPRYAADREIYVIRPARADDDQVAVTHMNGKS